MNNAASDIEGTRYLGGDIIAEAVLIMITGRKQMEFMTTFITNKTRIKYACEKESRLQRDPYAIPVWATALIIHRRKNIILNH